MPPDDERGAELPAPPVELDHAMRHIAAAVAEWRDGHLELARMHLREAVCDASWSLYAATVIASESSS